MDALCVQQVTCVVNSDARCFSRIGDRREVAEAREKDGGIEHAVAEFFRGIRKLGAREDEVVFVHPGAAAGGVREDRIHVTGKCGEIFACEFLRGIKIADMPRKRAAARLCVWDDDFDAVAREHLDGRGVDVRR